MASINNGLAEVVIVVFGGIIPFRLLFRHLLERQIQIENIFYCEGVGGIPCVSQTPTEFALMAGL